MSQFPGNARLPRIILGSLAFAALLAAAPMSGARAQVPYDMLLLDPPQPPQPSRSVVMTTKDQHTRNAYARGRKTAAH